MQNNCSDIAIKGVSPVIDIDSIMQSVKTILFTNKRERIFRPNFGIDLDSHIFKTISEETAYAIKLEVMSAVSSDPRVTIEGLTVEPDEINNKYNVFIDLVYNGVSTSVDFSVEARGVL